MEFVRPEEIERESMRIISEELALRNIFLPDETAAVVKRVIHTTADFDYAESLYFSADAVSGGITALKKGTVLVTDTNMALAGVSKPGLARLGCSAVCYMADPEVAEEASALGVTRAVISVRHAAAGNPGCIYAVGNAPTALFELAEQIIKGFRPSLIIAVPVGFVNVTEAKEAVTGICRQTDIPVIASLGRKGGSTVAAAICNALIYKAAGLR